MYDPIELVERSSDAAFAVDGSLRVLAWNAHAEALLAISHQEATMQTCYGILAGRSEQGVPICGPTCTAATCFLRDAPYTHPRVVVRGAGGKERLVAISSIVLPSPSQVGVPKAIIFLRPVDPLGEARNTDAPILRVYTLGQFRLVADARDLDWRAWPRKQAVTLLRILVSHRGRPVHRDALLEALWPDVDPEAGLKRLKVVVHALRRGLEPKESGSNGSSYIVTEGEGYCLPVGAHLWVDADRFQELAQRAQEAIANGLRQEAMANCEDAMAVYQGDYLEEELYSDWVASPRERLQELYLTLLFKAASLYTEAGLLEQAVETCQKAIAIDPCRESVHRLLMQSLWKAGRRAEALRQFNLCRQALRQELSVDPMPETLALYHRVLNGAVSAVAVD